MFGRIDFVSRSQSRVGAHFDIERQRCSDARSASRWAENVEPAAEGFDAVGEPDQARSSGGIAAGLPVSRVAQIAPSGPLTAAAIRAAMISRAACKMRAIPVGAAWDKISARPRAHGQPGHRIGRGP